MSSSEVQQEKAQNIQIRRVRILSESQLPTDYGTTPGGTMFGTTPGGTRIIYDRAFLLECRNSPLAQSPLANLPRIPGVTCPAERGSPGKAGGGTSSKAGGSPRSLKAPVGLPEQKLETVSEDKASKPAAGAVGDDPQFDMDI